MTIQRTYSATCEMPENDKNNNVKTSLKCSTRADKTMSHEHATYFKCAFRLNVYRSDSSNVAVTHESIKLLIDRT